MLLWTSVYRCLFESLLSIIWVIYSEVEFLDTVVENLILFRFWNFFSGLPVLTQMRISPSWIWAPELPQVSLSGEDRSVWPPCLHLIPEVTDHTDSFSFSNGECWVCGTFQPGPRLHSTEVQWGHILKLHFWSLGWTFSPSQISEPSAERRLGDANLMLRNQCQDFWKWLGLKGRKRIPSSGLSGVRLRAPREEPGDSCFRSRFTLKTLMCLNNRSLSLLMAGSAPLTGWPTNHFWLMTLAPSSFP